MFRQQLLANQGEARCWGAPTHPLFTWSRCFGRDTPRDAATSHWHVEGPNHKENRLRYAPRRGFKLRYRRWEQAKHTFLLRPSNSLQPVAPIPSHILYLKNPFRNSRRSHLTFKGEHLMRVRFSQTLRICELGTAIRDSFRAFKATSVFLYLTDKISPHYQTDFSSVAQHPLPPVSQIHASIHVMTASPIEYSFLSLASS